MSLENFFLLNDNMFQLTFSEQSLNELNSLHQSEQLELMDKLSSLTNEILSGENSSIGSLLEKVKFFTD